MCNLINKKKSVERFANEAFRTNFKIISLLTISKTNLEHGNI